MSNKLPPTLHFEYSPTGSSSPSSLPLSQTSTANGSYQYDAGCGYRDYELDSLSESSTDDGDTESGSWSDDTLAGNEWPFVSPTKRSHWRRSSSRWIHIVVAGVKGSPRVAIALLAALISGLALLLTWPFPTTIHIVFGVFVGLTTWVVLNWIQLARLGSTTIARRAAMPSASTSSCLPIVQSRGATMQLLPLLLATCVVLFALFIGVTPPVERFPEIPRGPDHKYFIGANLYNNERILPHWTSQLFKVIDHLGPENTFVSIYESNSNDKTPKLVEKLRADLEEMGVRNRVLSEKGSTRWWPYITSPERIEFLAQVRNRVLEPLQSNDSSIRLPDYDQFEKVIFLNDVLYSWESVIRLIGTEIEEEDGTMNSNYDLTCGMDFQFAGLYDTWVARDVCGTPLRIAWPFVKDPVSVRALREMKSFPVSACWNGLVVFRPEPFLWQPPKEDSKTKSQTHLQKRGWKMIDDPKYPGGRMSPALTTPIQFRASEIEACDHSECFLFSYDLQRLYNTPDRPARIWMNPTVQVAYKWRWYAWYAKVLRIPAVEWWTYYWSHGKPAQIVDWVWEGGMRSRDYCTWSALTVNAPARCPQLPGVPNRSWDT